MKKAWKMSSEATRKSTLSLLKRYLDSGNKPMKARALAAKTAGVSPGTVYAWEKKAKTTTKTTNNTTKRSKEFITSINVRSTTGAEIKLTREDIGNIARLAGHVC